jgi:hypothetical protein
MVRLQPARLHLSAASYNKAASSNTSPVRCKTECRKSAKY